MDQSIWRWDATAVAAAIRTGKISSREATQSVLARLEAVNPKLNAVTVVLAEQALAAADRADAALRRGEAPGLLHGVPVTVKENIDQEGQATANGVVAFKDVIAATDSPPVAAWRRAGAVIVGRTNTPAFSLRWHTDNDLRGRTFNPWHRDRTPGGSSGGCAAAPAPLGGPPVTRPIRVALTVDPSRQGVHPDVAAAVRAAGAALADAGYAVEEVEPPDVAGVATCWSTIVINELRHVTQPYIRKHGGVDINRSLDFTLAGTPDVDLAGYMKALGERTKHVRDWMLFLERYPLVVGPVSTEPPFEVGFDTTSQKRADEVARAQRLLVAVNLLGVPAGSPPRAGAEIGRAHV